MHERLSTMRHETPRLRRGHRASTRPTSLFAASASLVFVLSVASVLPGTTTAWAGASASPVRLANGSAYCKLLVLYNQKQSAANKALSSGSAAKQMKTAFAKLQSEEGQVLAVAPSSLQKPFKTVFAALGQLFGALAKVNYNYAKLSKTMIASFTKDEKSMAAATKLITAYDKNVCGVKS